jgi:hypothetical protein
MHRLVNTTPFAAEFDVLPDAHGVDTLYLTIKASFDLAPRIAVSPHQREILACDVHWGEPDRTSLRYPSERHLSKPGTDVVVIGSAHAPRHRPVTTLDVSLSAGPLRKVVRVLGDRRRTAAGVSAPRPFVTMPLIYERAFGGPGHPVNPTGVGLHGDESLPNLEHPHAPFLAVGDSSSPACFAAVPPGWWPRSAHAGTYDEAWRRGRAPYLPVDFDPRFFHATPPDQHVVGHFRGGERIELEHASPEPLRFALPTCRFVCKARVAGRTVILAPNLETVQLEPDDGHLSLLWRAAAAVDRRVLEIDEIAVSLRRMDLHHGADV